MGKLETELVSPNLYLNHMKYYSAMVSLNVSSHSTSPNPFPSFGNIHLGELWLLGHMEVGYQSSTADI